MSEVLLGITTNSLDGMAVALMLTLALLPAAFWVWMFTDCIQNELPGSREKTTWIVGMLIFSVLGALAYNVSRRKQRIKELGR